MFINTIQKHTMTVKHQLLQALAQSLMLFGMRKHALEALAFSTLDRLYNSAKTTIKNEGCSLAMYHKARLNQ